MRHLRQLICVLTFVCVLTTTTAWADGIMYPQVTTPPPPPPATSMQSTTTSGTESAAPAADPLVEVGITLTQSVVGLL